MQPFALHTQRLVLNQPALTDVDDIARYCSEPVFERFMVTPWPYERAHAEAFVEEYVPGGWARNDEWTWAIREAEDQRLLGVVGVRLDNGMVGFWLGSPHRGRGVMREALNAVVAVVAAVFDKTELDQVLWECAAGNRASLRVAQKVGFRFAGQSPGRILGRDGEAVDSWTGELKRSDDRTEKPGWPI